MSVKKIEFINYEIPGFTQIRQELETNKTTIPSFIDPTCGGQRSKSDIRSEIPKLNGSISCLAAKFGLQVTRNNSFAAVYWMSLGHLFTAHTLESRNADKVILYFLRPSTATGFLRFNSDTLVQFDANEKLGVLFNGTDNWETLAAIDTPDTLLLEVLVYKC